MNTPDARPAPWFRSCPLSASRSRDRCRRQATDHEAPHWSLVFEPTGNGEVVEAFAVEGTAGLCGDRFKHRSPQSDAYASKKAGLSFCGWKFDPDGHKWAVRTSTTACRDNNKMALVTGSNENGYRQCGAINPYRAPGGGKEGPEFLQSNAIGVF